MREDTTSSDHLLNLQQEEELPPLELVLDEDFADPSVFRVKSSATPLYVAHATETVKNGQPVRIQTAVSSDLKHWELLPTSALTQTPEWSTGNKLWAPFVREAPSGNFYLYYCTETKRDGSSGISVAVSANPLSGFVDTSRAPLVSGRYKTEMTAEIDPFVGPDEEGELALSWGSATKPILRKKLNKEGTALLDPLSPATVLLQPIPHDFYERVLEGIFEHTNHNDRYLFYSGADCFGNGNNDLDATGSIPERIKELNIEKPGEYAVMVAKYNKQTGVYEKKAEATGSRDSVILEGNSRWKNPGNNSVVTDEKGTDWLFTHAIDRTNPYFAGTRMNRRPMVRAPLIYRNGWPEVQYGRLPDKKA